MTLFQLMRLAKTDPEAAGKEILAFVEKTFSLPVERIEINQSAVSLNSVNGFLHIAASDLEHGGEILFFKFHAEEGETETMDEYYRAELLEKAGFPVISPLYKSTKPGEQFLIYPKIDVPTFFDACEKQDRKFLAEGEYDMETYTALLDAELHICHVTREIFERTLHTDSSQTVSEEAIWQLFTKRLLGDEPRIQLFYEGKSVALPNGETMNFDDLAEYTWEINGVRQQENLAHIIYTAKEVVNPSWQKTWACVTAHGDDHNGNKFFFFGEETPIKFFDPAFAGEHIPVLLAFVKSTFHDTFAHPLWLYNSPDVEDLVDFSFTIDHETKVLSVTHNLTFDRAPLRQEFLKIKLNELWKPLLKLLNGKNMLPEGYETFLQKTLFCCPFLVINLIDPSKYSPKMSFLGLSKAVEMGNMDIEIFTAS